MTNRIADTDELGILVRQNIRLARRCAARQLAPVAIDRLRDLTKTFGFSLSLGDVQYSGRRMVCHPRRPLAPIPAQTVCWYPSPAGASAL